MAKTAIQALDAIRKTVTVSWQLRSETEAKALLIRTARQGHVQIMREQTLRSGFLPEYEAYANTPANTNIETVEVPGPIVYRYFYMREIVHDIIKALEAASPIDKGDYKKGHGLWIDGIEVDKNTPIRPGHEVFISNTVPYARRIEVGKTNEGRAFVMQVPPDIYKRIAATMAAKYENVAIIKHGYVQLPDAWEIKGKLGPTYKLPTGKRRKRRQHIGEFVRAPAIFIEHLPA